MNKLTYYCFSLLLLLPGFDGAAQTFTPIREKGVRRPVSEVSEARLTVSGNYLYFVGRETSTGSELWRTDGTPEGTRLVKDITPGPQVGDLAPVSLFDANGTLYFFVGTSLYKTDGSEAGTVLLRTFSDIGGANLLYYKGLVIFKVLGGIWRTDGTPEGTFPLSSRGDAPRLFNDTLYFYTASGPTFQETDLFRTDGTREGTSLIRQFSGTLQSLGVGIDGLYLTFLTGNFHPTPGQWSTWKSDGTTAGTRQLGSTSTTSQPGYFNAFGDLYQRQNFTGLQPTFRQNRSTGAFEPVIPTHSISVLRQGSSLYTGQIYGPDFTPATGTELSRLDGTPVRDLNPGPGTGIVYQPVVYNGLLYFAGSNASENFELWQSDGTADGTRLSFEQRPGERGSYPLNLTVFRGALYFDTWDGTLWKLSGDQKPPVTPPTSTLSLLPPDYDCLGGGLTVQLSGGDGSPIEYRVVGLRDWSSRADFLVPPWQRTGTTFTLDVRQNGQVVSRSFTPACSNARLASPEPAAPFDAVLYPNPVGEQFSVAVKGAGGQIVRFALLNLNGRTLVEQRRQVESDQHTEFVTLPGGSPAGLYLLQISTEKQTKTLKVVKQ